jgi:hypothetical protein
MLLDESERRIEVAKDLIVGLGARPFEDIFRNSRMIEEVHCERDKILDGKSFDNVLGKFIQGSDRWNHDNAGNRRLPWRRGQEAADCTCATGNPDILSRHETFLARLAVPTQADEFSLRAQAASACAENVHRPSIFISQFHRHRLIFNPRARASSPTLFGYVKCPVVSNIFWEYA